MIIPKTLNKFYMLTEGNTLYLIVNVGYETIEPRKATITRIICANTEEPKEQTEEEILAQVKSIIG